MFHVYKMLSFFSSGNVKEPKQTRLRRTKRPHSETDNPDVPMHSKTDAQDVIATSKGCDIVHVIAG